MFHAYVCSLTRRLGLTPRTDALGGVCSLQKIDRWSFSSSRLSAPPPPPPPVSLCHRLPRDPPPPVLFSFFLPEKQAKSLYSLLSSSKLFVRCETEKEGGLSRSRQQCLFIAVCDARTIDAAWRSRCPCGLARTLQAGRPSLLVWLIPFFNGCTFNGLGSPVVSARGPSSVCSLTFLWAFVFIPLLLSLLRELSYPLPSPQPPPPPTHTHILSSTPLQSSSQSCFLFTVNVNITTISISITTTSSMTIVIISIFFSFFMSTVYSPYSMTVRTMATARTTTTKQCDN